MSGKMVRADFVRARSSSGGGSLKRRAGSGHVLPGGVQVGRDPRQFMERTFATNEEAFFHGQLDQAAQELLEAPLEQWVGEHRAERRPERKRKPAEHAVPVAAIEHLQRRQVGFSDRLEQPGSLWALFVFRMPHER